MKTFITVVAVVLCFYSFDHVLGLKCLQCTSDADGEGCLKADESFSKPCLDNSSADDVCVKITTRIEYPHGGPQDSSSKHKDRTTITRTCGNRKGLARFTEVNECSDQTLGGGGEQEQCVCTGNNCNSSDRVVFSLSSLLLAILYIVM